MSNLSSSILAYNDWLFRDKIIKLSLSIEIWVLILKGSTYIVGFQLSRSRGMLLSSLLFQSSCRSSARQVDSSSVSCDVSCICRNELKLFVVVDLDLAPVS